MAGQYSISLDLIKKRLGQDRVIQLTNDANTGTVDQANVDEAILSAEAELHLYAGVYYATPLRLEDGTTVPPGIKELLADSTCWRLMTRRPEFMRNTNDEGDYWESRRKEVVAWLKSIADPDARDRLLIPGAKKPSAAVEPRGGASTVETDDPRFSTKSLKGMFS